MPAILTHHLFGIEVYDELEQVIGASASTRDAFLLGNQGADPLLCLKALPSTVAYRNIGTIMHTERPAKLLETVHQRMVESADAQANGALPAFALGLLCHYLLDSIAHPLVLAQQNAICAAGIQGLPSERAGSIVHALIETELDERILDAKLGITVESFLPHAEALQCGERELWAISAALRLAVHDTYGFAIPSSTFACSVHLYRSAQRVVDSRRGSSTLPSGLMQFAGEGYLRFRAFTHSTLSKKQIAFANEDHVPWEHPHIPGAVMDASFDELYAQAFERALEALPAFARKDFSASDCEALVNNVDYYGEIVSDD